MSNKLWYVGLMFVSFVTNATPFSTEYVLETLYGNYTITEPVLIELLHCPTIQRLQRVNQYGINDFIRQPFPYTRFIHSLNVLAVLIHFKAPLLEQIAGLLHDASHTAFSHVADFMPQSAETYGQDSYQDSIHQWFLEQTEIPEILKKYTIALSDILHKNKHFTCLEQNLPDVCADRFEYLLYGGFIEGLITPEEVGQIVNHTRFENDQWYFIDQWSARILADTSLLLTEHHFGAAWNYIINQGMANILDYALDKKYITWHEFQFGTDEVIWKKMHEISDSVLQEKLFHLKHYKNTYTLLEHADTADVVIKPKFRGINPLVLTPQGLQRLTDIDADYKQAYERVQNLMKSGWPIRFNRPAEHN